jgi:hypothetical protein
MENIFYKTILVSLIFLFTGCTTVQKRSIDQLPIIDPPETSYKKDVLPVIIEQINKTAATFFYDRGESRGIPVDNDKPPPRNAIVGENETGGICMDYASHFIDNYKGLGEVYYLSVDLNGKAVLQRRVKPFEKNDIIVSDVTSVDFFIEETYQEIIDQAEEGSCFSQKNYKAERDRQKEDIINNFYSAIIQENKDNKEFTVKERSRKVKGWHIEPLILHINKDGKIFIIEEIPIPTPLSHAGKTEKEDFFNHAWIRIIWKGMTIDIDPTWYDNGRPLEFGVIEVVIQDRVNTFPQPYADFMELTNTSLINVPMTGTLKSGDSYIFTIESTDYSNFALIIDENWTPFTRNKTVGYFELIYKIPENIETIDICGVAKSGNKWKAVGLIGYKVEQLKI